MAANRVLVDAGPLVAVYDRNDQHHQICVDAFRGLTAQSCTCWPVLAEAVYLLRNSPKSIERLLEKVETGHLQILPLDATDAAFVKPILQKYADQKVDRADACLVHLAEREGIADVVTLDRRHFLVHRISGDTPLKIVP